MQQRVCGQHRVQTGEDLGGVVLELYCLVVGSKDPFSGLLGGLVA